MRRPDVVLIHPPSVYDFRKRDIVFGPLSDVIPSTPVFEMYPVGFLTLAAHLRRCGWRVRIVNLALRMMRSRSFDVEHFLLKLKPRLFGIDLHWLPHAHGGPEIARVLKRLHPEIPIVFGGISATYFHEELIRFDAVDFVLRGSVAEEPLAMLMRELEGERRFERVPGLTWKERGEVRSNALPPPPATFDTSTFDLGEMIASVITGLDFWTSIPFEAWWRHPITAVFTVRGCARHCAPCGAPRHRILCSPRAIAESARELAMMTRAPIFLVGDLLDGGESYAYAVLEELKRARIDNRIVFEFFRPPPRAFVEVIDNSVRHWGAELSPESHDEHIRAQFGKAQYTNAAMESAMEAILATRCERLDLFYLIGIPGQTYQSVIDTTDHIADLLQRFDRRVSAYMTPLGPFLDPGSDGFEHPEWHGYILHARTLAEHRALLEQNDWGSTLNYETRWMSREEIVAATNEAARRLGSRNTKEELFPSAPFLRNFRIGGIARLLARTLVHRLVTWRSRRADVHHGSARCTAPMIDA